MGCGVCGRLFKVLEGLRYGLNQGVSGCFIRVLFEVYGFRVSGVGVSVSGMKAYLDTATGFLVGLFVLLVQMTNVRKDLI